jgi:hypothetical protein
MYDGGEEEVYKMLVEKYVGNKLIRNFKHKYGRIKLCVRASNGSTVFICCKAIPGAPEPCTGAFLCFLGNSGNVGMDSNIVPSHKDAGGLTSSVSLTSIPR